MLNVSGQIRQRSATHRDVWTSSRDEFETNDMLIRSSSMFIVLNKSLSANTEIQDIWITTPSSRFERRGHRRFVEPRYRSKATLLPQLPYASVCSILRGE